MPPTSVCIVMAGGGTGGHLAPGLALADKLSRRLDEVRIVFLGTGRPVEDLLIRPAGWELRASGAVRLPSGLASWPLFPFRLWRSIVRAKAALRELAPGVVIGLGGYGSFPVVVAARRLRIPSVLLEQNSIPGKANRWLSRVAEEVYVQFERSRGYFRHPERVHALGNPLRRGIAEGSRERAVETFSLDVGLRTLLVLGGSQGARRINEAVCDALGELASLGVQIVHQTGASDVDWVSARYRETGTPGHVTAFIGEMPDALAAADLVISRAGATTLAELAAVGRAMILVPYPLAAEGHQQLNAQVFADAGAAVIVPDAQLDGARLVQLVGELMRDDARRHAMAEAARTLARPDATREVSERILNLLKKRDR